VMMMTQRRLSLHDIEYLSAYLDGQLSPHQRKVLEARLRREVGLQKQLEGLQKTRSLLRSSGRLHAPRNFTLSPQTAGIRASSRLPALFGAVSALSSALLVIFVIGSLLLSNTAQPASLAGDDQAMSVEVKAVESEAEALSMAKDVATPTKPALLGAAPPSEETSRIAEPSPEAFLVPPAASYPSPEDVAALEIQALATATPTSRPTATPLPTALPTPLPYEVALPGVMAAGSGEESLPEGTSAKAPEPTPPPAASPLSTVLFTGEMILAGVALVTAITALILLLRSRR
ncbi:MAG TPA: hypothetical protein VLM83_12600, partial [Anaerolineales bacterium]|nr:hypothetical protein [Anaerolineales bacterium]